MRSTIIQERRFLRFFISNLMIGMIAFFGFVQIPPEDPIVAVADEVTYPYTQTFTISAYYSPLEGQNYYVTGSYEGDIYLNGNGTNGADGTEVYPGMIAAPGIYDFGTKIYIPGIGMTAVHDRGGAIVEAGEREQAYDRLDIWMGYGDSGLSDALDWGVRTVECTVYGVDNTIVEEVYFDVYLEASTLISNVVSPPTLFSGDLWYGTESEDIIELQEYLAILGYYDDEIDGYYGDDTWSAVFSFQVDQGILDNEYALGAGHFGPTTRRSLESALSDVEIEKELERIDFLKEGLAKIQQYTDLSEDPVYLTNSLSIGDRGEDVYALQEELVNLGYLLIEPTGYYGEVTEHAVFKLQQKLGLVSSMDDEGAGVAGPKTRGAINEITDDRIDMKIYVAESREDDGVFIVKADEEEML